MKTITIKQPWAQLICEGLKDIENRTWTTRYRGRVLIHSGLCKKLMNIPPNTFMNDDQLGALLNSGLRLNEREWNLYGAIIGSVEIVDCVINHSSIWAEQTPIANLGMLKVQCQPNIYNWVLANPILFPEPIPAKGKLSFWEYNAISNIEKDGDLVCDCKHSIINQDEETAIIMIEGKNYCRFCGGLY